MPDEENKSPAENLPTEGIAPPAATGDRKPNGEAPDEPTPDAAATKPRGKKAKAKEPSPDKNDDLPIDIKPGSGPDGETTPEDLDEDAREFARLRRDLPNVGGSAAIGIISIGVTKAPPRNEFFRTKKGFRPIVDIVVDQVGMEHKFYAVHPDMREELQLLGISFAPHTLYLIITTKGAFRVIPVRCPDVDGVRNEYSATKELVLREAEDTWLRMYTDRENANYRKYPAPDKRFSEPVWPELTDAKIFRLCFRDRGALLETPNHPRVMEWAARQAENDAQ